jgi:hypothetical protein
MNVHVPCQRIMLCERIGGWRGGSTTFGISRRKHARLGYLYSHQKPNVMMDENNNNTNGRKRITSATATRFNARHDSSEPELCVCKCVYIHVGATMGYTFS